MQATTNTSRAKKTTAKKPVVPAVVATHGAGDTPMFAEMASLLSVLSATPGDPAPIEVVGEAPVEIIGDEPEVLIVESASVELLDPFEPPLQMLFDASPDDQNTALEAVIATLELQEHYALVPEGEAPHEGANAEEIAAAGSVLPVSVEQVAGDVAAPAATPRATRVHCQNKTDRIKARLGAILGDYLVLEVAGASLEGDALKEKQDETMALIDAINVSNRASLLMDRLSGSSAKPNEIVQRGLDALEADAKFMTGDKLNPHLSLLSKPYSVNTTRAMGRNTIMVREQTKVIVAGAIKVELTAPPIERNGDGRTN